MANRMSMDSQLVVSQSEQLVMEVLWRESPLSSTDVVAKLQGQSWTEKTVKTFLNRLVKKGAIDFVKDGRRYMYSPVVKRQDYLNKQSAGFVKRVFGGDMNTLLTTFVQNEHVTEKELDYLRRLLDQNVVDAKNPPTSGASDD